MYSVKLYPIITELLGNSNCDVKRDNKTMNIKRTAVHKYESNAREDRACTSMNKIVYTLYTEKEREREREIARGRKANPESYKKEQASENLLYQTLNN